MTGVMLKESSKYESFLCPSVSWLSIFIDALSLSIRHFFS